MAEEEKIGATIAEFKGNPVISLPVAGSMRYPFTFGLNKAKAILEYYEDIKKFVEEQDAKKEKENE